MNLVNRFIDQVRSAPERSAIIQVAGGIEKAVTYQELNELSARAAGFFRELGVKEGDVVLVFERMSIDLYAMLIGLWKIGAIAMFVDPSGGKKLLEASCRIGKPVAFVAVSKAHLYRFVSKEIRRIRIKVTIGRRYLPSRSWGEVSNHDRLGAVSKVELEQPALYTFTSGSTGNPKAASRTHGLLLAQHTALVDEIDLKAGEVDLATLPIFALANLASGLTTLIPDCDLSRPGFIQADKVLQQIEEHRPDRCVASPAFLMRIEESARKRGTHLRISKIFTGGAPVFPRYLHALKRVALNAEITVVFGSTEAEPISHVSLSQISESDFENIRLGKGLLVGKLSPHVSLKIVEDRTGESLFGISQEQFDRMALPTGQPGEIVVAGSHVLSGYLNGEGDEENKIPIGERVWHRTGDTGYIDSDHRLWLLGRCSSKLEIGGAPVYPFSIEAAVSMDDRIAWSALIAIGGKRILALEQREGSSETLKLSELPIPQNIVDEIVPIKRMPLDKRHNAKIDYRELRKLLESRVD